MRPANRRSKRGVWGAGWARRAPAAAAARRDGKAWGRGSESKGRAGRRSRLELRSQSPSGIPRSPGSQSAAQARGNGAGEVVHQRPPREQVTGLESGLGEGL